MNINPIKTETDYEQTLAEIDALFGATPDTPEGDRLDVLITLVEAYERKHHPIGLPDPIAAIEHYLESHQMREHDLVGPLEGGGNVLMVMKREKPLSLKMMRNLNEQFGIPLEILVQPYALQPDKFDFDGPPRPVKSKSPTRSA